MPYFYNSSGFKEHCAIFRASRLGQFYNYYCCRHLLTELEIEEASRENALVSYNGCNEYG